ncbi:MAG TPA: endonuclease/exonuclease/phosphatase family protein [Myxococcaceae bacterium]|nr:endonuclease/exonuclease/phosphatase family protein [Myxococcaceae bacterium]
MARIHSRRWFAGPPAAVVLVAALVACGDPTLNAEPNPACVQQPLVASRGDPGTLDVATWNVDWFGHTGFGPEDEALQQANARDVIAGTDFDVWGLEEVVGGAAFDDLQAQLPGYTGLLANDALVSDGSTYYSNAEQKPAILYKSDLASLISAQIILADHNFDFAGRPPMEVKLNVTLNGLTEERTFIVLHMKAFNDAASWERRSNASAALKSYLDENYPTQKVLVIGDWNDDVDTSIARGRPSPYQEFVDDTDRYAFATQSLSAMGERSTCGHPDVIDHQLNTNEQRADLITDSVEVYRLDEQIPDYCTTTSDHFPVLARYQFGGGTSVPARVNPPASDRPCAVARR